MFNITGGEVIIIAIIALVILGPDKLPDFIRRAGRVYAEVKKATQGFKTEFREVLDEPVREMQDTVNLAKNWFEEGKAAVGTMDDVEWNKPVTPAIEPTPGATVSDPGTSPAVTADPVEDPATGEPVATTGGEQSGPDQGEGDGPDLAGDEDGDDDPNVYGDDGRLFTFRDLPSTDTFGSVVTRPGSEDQDA